MSQSNKEKAKQLGVSSWGAACCKLRNEVMFSLLTELGRNTCFRCGKTISTSDQLSIDHKADWMYADDATDKFFSMENIAFSHRQCNTSASRTPSKVKSQTGFKGVNKHGKRYRVQISKWENGKKSHIQVGYFDDPVEAAKAYDEAAVCHYGERAVTNKQLGLI